MDSITEFNIAPNRRAGGTQEDLTALHDLAKSHPQIELAHVSNSFITLRGPAETLNALVAPFQPKLMAEENKSLPPIDNGPFFGGFTPSLSSESAPLEVIEDTPSDEEAAEEEEEVFPLVPSTNGTSRLH
ncbi:MAG: hypothetical protein ACRBBK_11860 [Paracoccaceae bacterium]